MHNATSGISLQKALIRRPDLSSSSVAICAEFYTLRHVKFLRENAFDFVSAKQGTGNLKSTRAPQTFASFPGFKQASVPPAVCGRFPAPEPLGTFTFETTIRPYRRSQHPVKIRTRRKRRIGNGAILHRTVSSAYLSPVCLLPTSNSLAPPFFIPFQAVDALKCKLTQGDRMKHR